MVLHHGEPAEVFERFKVDTAVGNVGGKGPELMRNSPDIRLACLQDDQLMVTGSRQAAIGATNCRSSPPLSQQRPRFFNSRLATSVLGSLFCTLLGTLKWRYHAATTRHQGN